MSIDVNDGHIFLLVGNSGSGKDSIIREVQNRWIEKESPLFVPKRYITRPPHPTEPFISVSQEEFQSLYHDGKFCLHWKSYDTWYGVSMDVLDQCKVGQKIILNASRDIVDDAKKKYPIYILYLFMCHSI